MGKDAVNSCSQELLIVPAAPIFLALRGDPPREKEKWEATEGGFLYAKDLVTHIRQTYGSHFDIGVCWVPRGMR